MLNNDHVSFQAARTDSMYKSASFTVAKQMSSLEYKTYVLYMYQYDALYPVQRPRYNRYIFEKRTEGYLLFVSFVCYVVVN